MERRSFFAWLLGLIWGTSQVAAKPDLSAAQALFDDAIVLKPQVTPAVTRLGNDTLLLIADWQDDVVIPLRPVDTTVLQLYIDRAAKIVWLQGSPADVEAFCRLYQAKLWPGFQQHPLVREVERDFQRARPSWATGSGALVLHGWSVLDQTIQAWDRPFVIV